MTNLKNLAFVILAMSLPALSESIPEITKLPHNVEIQKLNPNAFVATDKDYHNSNVLIVKMNDGTVVISSSPFESKGTESMMKWITTALKPKRTVAINTHYHLDGTGGNEVYKNNGVEIWASDLTKKFHQASGQKMINGAAKDFKDDLKQRLLRSQVVLADNIFNAEEGKTFDFSGEKVEVFYPGPAHSQDNVVVYFPKHKILFGGCMIKPTELGYLGDADVKTWPNSARKLKRFDVQTVIRGHGSYGGSEMIDKTITTAEKASVPLKGGNL